MSKLVVNLVGNEGKPDAAFPVDVGSQVLAVL